MRVIFAETLKKLRAEKGLSQRELAERLYVTRSTVARWENGSRLPDAAMISRLSSCRRAACSGRGYAECKGHRLYPAVRSD